jgi:DNA-binding GntR family transcriptional regulator
MVIKVPSLREEVYRYFRDEMRKGTLAPGSTINLNAISEKLGVSKTPLRDALIQLESEGFVRILPRRGVLVRELTLDEVRDFYEIIGALEATVISRVFDAVSDQEIRRMQELNDAQRASFAAGDHDRYYEENLAFHDVFLELSPNQTISRLTAPLKRRLYDFPRPTYVAEWENRNMDDHDRLITMLKSGDREGAARLLKDIHWSFAVQEEYIREFYRFDGGG